MLSFIEFYRDQTEIEIKDEGYFHFKLMGKKAVFAMDINIHSNPEWISDQGNGTVTIQNFTINLNIIPKSKEGKMQFEFD
mgnify:CR=1 FL=1